MDATMLNRQELLLKIQQLDFYAVDLNLYLDTHPADSQALKDYRYVVEAARQYKKIYENTYGPLINFGEANITNTDSWAWIAQDSKWPWENV